MKKSLLLLTLAAALIALPGCFKQEGVTKKVLKNSGINGVKVAENVDFNFFSDATIDLTGAEGTVVKVYDNDPNAGGKLLISDVIDETGVYSNEVSIEGVETLYIETNGAKRAELINPVFIGQDRRVMFEDKNTETTDFDFNDVVVDYSWTVDGKIINKKKYAAAAQFLVDVAAYGAFEKDGFAIKLDGFSADAVESVKVNGTAVPFTTAATVNPVIYVVDDLSAAFGDTIVNTDPAKAAVRAKSYQIDITFKDGKLALGTAASFAKQINPFVFKTENRTTETHVYPKKSVDGTTSYATSNGLPWAIEVPTTVGYVLERTPIDQAYTKFVLYATGNNDKVNRKWYNYPNAELIYIGE